MHPIELTARRLTMRPRQEGTIVRGILFSQMQPPPELAEEFHDWYDTEHIPARLAIDGFARASRYQAVEGAPHHLAVYELDDLAALEQPSYRLLKEAPSERTRRMLAGVSGFTRFTCAEIAVAGRPGEHPYLSVVAFPVPATDTADFDDWYEREHAPKLLAAADWLCVRRYRVLGGEGGPWTRLALHELASTEVMRSPERAAARRGPKRDALAEKHWFGDSGRWSYQRISTHS